MFLFTWSIITMIATMRILSISLNFFFMFLDEELSSLNRYILGFFFAIPLHPSNEETFVFVEHHRDQHFPNYSPYEPERGISFNLETRFSWKIDIKWNILFADYIFLFIWKISMNYLIDRDLIRICFSIRCLFGTFWIWRWGFCCRWRWFLLVVHR